jgi:CRP/FNR family transcriptional regulator, cyclic AMP receptor protein
VRSATPDPAVLAKMPLFRGFLATGLSRLAALMHERSFPAGSTIITIITAEQPGEAIYVILEGSVKANTIRPDGREVVLAILGPGEVIGEMSLADSLGSSADLTAPTRSRVSRRKPESSSRTSCTNSASTLR